MRIGRAFLLPALLVGAATAWTPAGSQQPAPPVQRVIPEKPRVIVLPEGVSLNDIRVVGRDLVVKLPNGKQMVIADGAVFVPTLVIGKAEIPASSLAALLFEEEPRVAAGGPSQVVNVSTRLFAPPGFAEFESFGAVGMIAFPQAPATVQESDRYRRICEAYVTILPDAIMARREDSRLRQMVTIWPRADIKKALSVYVPTPAAAAAECRRAVENYSYPAAAAWLARVPKRAGLKRMNRGPFLVAWAPSSAVGKPNSALLIFDLSDFEEAGGIQRAFRIWKAEIENDPSLWDDGWNVARWKAHTAAKLDKYGAQISGAIAMIPWLKG